MSSNVIIYTDGGCSPNPGLGGYAAILQCGDREKVVQGAEPDTTNYHMELMAVVKGLDALTKSCQVTIVSDSNNVVQGASEWMPRWIANGWRTSRNKDVEHRDLWEQIHTHIKTHDITFVKVKAHVADNKASDAEKMNNRVDKLVAEARAAYQAEPVDERSKYRLMIAGSRVANDKMLDYARRCVSHAIDNGWTIVVGDNPKGVDQVVVEELNSLEYAHVIVVGIARNPRNGGVHTGRYIRYGNTYTERDQAMAKSSDRGIFIWSGDEKTSPGTKGGADYMKSLSSKKVDLMDFSSTFA